MKKYAVVILSIFLMTLAQTVFADDAAEASMAISLQDIDDLNILMEAYQSAMKGYEFVMQGDIKSQLESITGTTTLGSLLNEDEDQVLNIVKAKYRLRNKNDAVKLVIKIYEENKLGPELIPEYIKKSKKIRR